MIIDYIFVFTALIWLIFASISDIKTREVPDWLNFSLILIALALKSIQSIIAKDISIILYALAALAVFLLLVNLMYFTKQWGGGDAKLVIGLGIIFTQYPSSLLQLFNPRLTIPFSVTFFLNLLLICAVYLIIYSFILGVKNSDKIIIYYKENKKHYKKFNIIFIPLLSLSIVISFFLKNPLNYLLLSISISLFILYFILLFTRLVESSLMIKEINTNKLTEGDWIYKPVYYKNRLLISRKNPGITKKDIILLKKYKIRNVIIKEGIPFVPAFLISTVISLIFGNFWLLV